MIKYHYNPRLDRYFADETFRYFSPRYKEWVVIYEGDDSDGATGAYDIHSSAWFIHDKLCEEASWHNGEPVTAWQAAVVLGDILWSEGRYLRAIYWPITTYLLGCKAPRQNGLF